MDRFLAEVCTLEWHHATTSASRPRRRSPRWSNAHPEYAEHIWAWPRRSEEMVAGPIDGTVEIARGAQAGRRPDATH